MDPIKNPYSPGAGNPPPELAGRTAVMKQIVVTMRRVAEGRSVQYPILVGLRGVGKTVLLVRARELAENDKLIVIDVEAHEGKTLPQLLVPGIRKAFFSLSLIEAAKEKARRGLRVLKGFLSGIKLNLGETDISLSIEPERGTADSGDLETDLPELIVALGEAAKSAGRSIAIIIDELQYLSSEEFSALIMSMHKVNQRSLPITMIGAGLPQILGLAGNSKSYSERLFTYPEIGALKAPDAEAAIMNPARSEGVSFSTGAIDKIMAYTHRYPYFIQQWAHDAWNVARGSRITEGDIEKANVLSIKALDESFFKVRFDRCTPSEKKYMRALAECGAGHHRSGEIADKLNLQTASAAPTRSGLIKKGMIYSPSYGETAFTVPLFDDYMKRAIPVFKAGR